MAVVLGIGGPGLAFAQTSATDCDDLSGLPINFTSLQFRADILPLLRDSGCAGCHASGDQYPELSGESLTPLIDLLANRGTGTDLSLVEPFSPQLSYLFQKINCRAPQNGSRMPLDGFALSLDQQGLI